MHFLSRMVWAALSCCLIAGCGDRELIPSPNLYVLSEDDPYENVPEHFRTNEVDVLYVTDRAQTDKDPGAIAYGYERSYSLGYGSATVRIGKEDTTWDQLVAVSRTHKRKSNFRVSITDIEEKGRFPETPFPLVAGESLVRDGLRHDSSVVATHAAVAEQLRNEVRERLAKTPRKHAYVFIHGYNTTFDDAVSVAGEVWHFMPRMGVPIAYTWPAGQGGLRGYFYDRESGEFTIFHLKEFLRILRSIDELEQIHLIAHSRGTDVTITALRELWIEMRELAFQNPDRPRKFGQIILAAPDLDLDVIRQRLAAEEIIRQFRNFTVYMSKSDVAIGFSTWLFVSQKRVGRLEDLELKKAEKMRQRAKMQRNLTLINARVDTEFIGHSYFYSHPAVLSDLILILRDGLPPGEAHGRPLKRSPGGLFWTIEDAYPAS
jgi:esterase/lipase superfamily enzyme